MEKELEGLKTKICRSCGIEKSINQFGKNSAFRTGYNTRCKICFKNNVYVFKNRTDKANENTDEEKNFRLINPTIKDYTEMWIIFEKMGYDLKKPIHIQFAEKWGLNYDEHHLNKEKIAYFSPKDCGLT